MWFLLIGEWWYGEFVRRPVRAKVIEVRFWKGRKRRVARARRVLPLCLAHIGCPQRVSGAQTRQGRVLGVSASFVRVPRVTDPAPRPSRPAGREMLARPVAVMRLPNSAVRCRSRESIQRPEGA